MSPSSKRLWSLSPHGLSASDGRRPGALWPCRPTDIGTPACRAGSAAHAACSPRSGTMIQLTHDVAAEMSRNDDPHDLVHRSCQGSDRPRPGSGGTRRSAAMRPRALKLGRSTSARASGTPVKTWRLRYPRRSNSTEALAPEPLVFSLFVEIAPRRGARVVQRSRIEPAFAGDFVVHVIVGRAPRYVQRSGCKSSREIRKAARSASALHRWKHARDLGVHEQARLLPQPMRLRRQFGPVRRRAPRGSRGRDPESDIISPACCPRRARPSGANRRRMHRPSPRDRGVSWLPGDH